ncbi:hypothetical protein [Rhodovulum visakhapatnamense]|uniref:Uncharacterized protein n=1 Tax=Rhodovulum visakhapatnamense TaxID=364297 RepID=A0A4R8FSL8_9RHOB|nr:hypothetical protein [Rhodovulum visakhapatnamense]TDX29625.1 hypothetical protein EV657_10844 [Rhodovulum visakhapatnamense]
MPSLRKLIGQGGRIALFLLALYLVVLCGLLIGPTFTAVCLVVLAVVGGCVLYLRNPDRADHWKSALPRRTRRETAPAATPVVPASATDLQDRPVQLPALRDPALDREDERPPRLTMLDTLGWETPAAMARDFAVLGLAGLGLAIVGYTLPAWPVLSWIAGLLKVVGVLLVLFSSGVLYSFGRELFWRGRG